MVDTGYVTPSGKIVVRGDPPIKIEKNVETATNVYPGRLLIKGTTDYDVAVGNGIAAPIGWAGFEHSYSKKDSKATIYAASDKITVLRGGGFSILGKMAKGFVALQGDDLFSWGNGMVAPGCFIRGMPALKVPFTKKTSVEDTNIDFPAQVLIHDAVVRVTTNDASGTIDVGFENAVESGDLDGLLDAEPCAVVGWNTHNMVDATDANNTFGALLYEVAIKDATGTPVYYRVPKLPGYITDGTIKSLVYTTSNHTIAGDIFILVSSPGIKHVGKAAYGVSAVAADADIVVESIL
jgi:hypothetical protein